MHTRSLLLVSVYVFFASLLCSVSMADTFYAQGDATISGGTPTGARGQELDLLIRNMGDYANDLKYAQKAYIRFDISTLHKPISNVELSLHVLEGLDTGSTNMDWTFRVLGLR